MFTSDTEDSISSAAGLHGLVTTEVFRVGLELHKAFGLISQNRNSGAQQHIRSAVGQLDNLVSGVRRTVGHGTDHRMLGVLFTVVGDLARGTDPIRFLDTIARHCVELLLVDAAGVILAEADRPASMVAAAATRASARNLLPLMLDSSHANSWRANQPLTTRLTAADNDPFATRAGLEGITTVQLLPVRSNDHVRGALVLLGASELAARDLTMADCLANLAGIAIA